MRFIALAILIPFIALSATLEVVVPERVVVYEENPKLLDIIKVKGPWKLRKILLKKRLKLSLRKGEGRYVTRGRIVSEILNAVDADILIKGRKRVFIYRKERVLSKGDVEKLVRAYIKDMGLFKGFRYSISVREPQKPIPIPHGTLKLKGLQERRGLQVVNIEVLKGGKTLKKIKARVYIKLEKKVVVASRDIERGSIIKKEDVELRFMDVSKLPRDAATTLGDVIGKGTLRLLRKGEVVRKATVRDIPLVKSGSPVYIVAENGLLKVTAMGKALESGRKGDVIKVRNESSKKIVYGEVVDRGVVMVRF